MPFAIRKRGGRSLFWHQAAQPPRQIDSGSTMPWSRHSPAPFRWRKLLETGVHGTIEEIAEAEKINASYVSRILRLTLLAPQIVEAILDGRQPEKMTLAILMEPFPTRGASRQLRSNSRLSDWFARWPATIILPVPRPCAWLAGSAHAAPNRSDCRSQHGRGIDARCNWELRQVPPEPWTALH